MLTFDRFRQRVVETGFPMATPHWQDMPHFDIDQHLHHIALAAPHDEAALVRLVNDIASMPLDHALPLWQAYVVDDVEGGSALITRVPPLHGRRHGHDDGDPAAVRPRPRGQAACRRRAPGGPASATGPARACSRPRSTSSPKRRATPSALAGGAGMLMGELLRADDPPSPLKGDFALGKQVAWSKPVAIRDIKAIGKRYDAKVNDVLVAAMTGALRTYLKGRGVDVDHTTVRAMVPVDLRPPERIGQLGNEFGLVLLDLAVTKARADHRLALTKARMDALKRSPEPLATKALLDLLGRGPKVLEDFSNDLFGRKASVVMTNVVGPPEELYLAGVPIDRILPWAPHPGKQLGMAVSILSYRGMAGLTVIGDAHLVPDPEHHARVQPRVPEDAQGHGSSGATSTPRLKAQRPRNVPAEKTRTREGFGQEDLGTNGRAHEDGGKQRASQEGPGNEGAGNQERGCLIPECRAKPTWVWCDGWTKARTGKPKSQPGSSG